MYQNSLSKLKLFWQLLLSNAESTYPALDRGCDEAIDRGCDEALGCDWDEAIDRDCGETFHACTQKNSMTKHRNRHTFQ